MTAFTTFLRRTTLGTVVGTAIATVVNLVLVPVRLGQRRRGA